METNWQACFETRTLAPAETGVETSALTPPTWYWAEWPATGEQSTAANMAVEKNSPDLIVSLLPREMTGTLSRVSMALPPPAFLQLFPAAALHLRCPQRRPVRQGTRSHLLLCR